MRTSHSRVLLVTLAIACVLALPLMAQGQLESTSTAATRTVVDHDGETVTIPQVVNRVAIIQPWPLPSIATVFLGSPEKLVGIPPAALGAAKAGLLGEIFPDYLNISTSFTDGSDVNMEELLKLKPDVVFVMAKNAKQKQMVKDAGLPAVAFSVNNWQYDNLKTYDAWIDLLGQVFPEYAKSDKVSAYSKQMYDMIQSRVKDIPDAQRKRVLFLFSYSDTSIVTSGKLFFGQAWCDEIGAKNVAEEVAAENSNAVINMEQVYTWNPDVILITNFTPTVPDDLYHNTIGSYDWSTVKAVKDGNVFKMPLGTYRSYTPSADTPVTLLWMAQKVYPELFQDYDLVAEVKRYYEQMYGISLTDDQIQRMYNQTAKGAEGTRR
ncbi:MAG: ABC transporter substrate-binding protein [Sphaerochaeta sp.]|jgi:iron complex transport system substrate-binding protein|nr:ABC transporter substrate-binding protein [Sphaerochaeta sp.]